MHLRTQPDNTIRRYTRLSTSEDLTETLWCQARPLTIAPSFLRVQKEQRARAFPLRQNNTTHYYHIFNQYQMLLPHIPRRRTPIVLPHNPRMSNIKMYFRYCIFCRVSPAFCAALALPLPLLLSLLLLLLRSLLLLNLLALELPYADPCKPLLLHLLHLQPLPLLILLLHSWYPYL